MSNIEIKGNGNFVFSGSESSKITINTMNNKSQIQDLVSRNKIDEALALLPNDSDTVLLASRWNRLKRDEMLGTISFSDAQQQRARIIQALLSYAGCDADAMPANRPGQLTHTSQGWEPQLLQIIKDNDRKNEDNAKRAIELLEAFRSYYDLKRTRAFFDRSGEKLEEIQQQFEDFKKTLNKSENESVEKFIDRVAEHLSARVPDWPSIADAYRLCLGRGFRSQFIEVNLTATPNDNDAKLSAVKTIEDFLGTL